MLSNDLIKAISGTFKNYGRNFDADVMEVWEDDLSPFTEQQILFALKRYRLDLSNNKAPSVGQIVALIDGSQDDGRPGAEEAWAAIKPLLNDEDSSAIVTVEMQQAYPAGFSGSRDEVGARMAFIETYRRLVAESRMNHISCKWVVWSGDNKEHRAEVVMQGIISGKISAAYGKNFLPAPTTTCLQLTDIVRENANRQDLSLPALKAPEIEAARVDGKKKASEILDFLNKFNSRV